MQSTGGQNTRTNQLDNPNASLLSVGMFPFVLFLVVFVCVFGSSPSSLSSSAFCTASEC